MDENFLDITSKVTVNKVEVGQRFSYSINIRNVSRFIVFHLIYREAFNKNIKIISVEVDGREINYTIGKDNILSLELDKINIEEKKVIYVTIEVLDYFDTGKISALGEIEGRVNREFGIQEIKQDIRALEIEIVNPKLMLTMISNVYETILGEEIEISIIAENMGTTHIYDVIIRDILKNGLKFIEGSVEVDKARMVKDNIISGVNISDLLISEVKIIKFKAIVVSEEGNLRISNKAVARFKYKTGDEELIKLGTAVSNIDRILVQADSIDMNISVSSIDISLNKVVEYSIDVINRGTVDLYNLLLIKEAVDELQLVKDSFKVNDKILKYIDLNKGVFIGDLPRGNAIKVNFKLKFIGGNNRGNINNIFILEKDCKLRNDNMIKGSRIKREVQHTTTISSFKQVMIEGEIVLGELNPYIKEVNNLRCDVEVNSFHLINCMKGVALDGQILTGKKLIVNGEISTNLEYTSLDEKGTVYFTNNNQIFSTFVGLPSSITENDNIAVTTCIEGAYCEVISNKSAKTIVSFLVVVKILNFEKNR